MVGKAKLGYKAFAESILIIPKVLAKNSGYDIQESIIMLQDKSNEKKCLMGLNLEDFDVIDPVKMGVYDNFCVKKLFLSLTTTLAE